jgi:hypothetical protein
LGEEQYTNWCNATTGTQEIGKAPSGRNCSQDSLRRSTRHYLSRIVYEEVQDIIYNVPEIKVLTSDRQLERIILLRNQLKPAMLGKSVFRVAPFVGAKEEDTEKAIAQTKVKELEARLEAGMWHHRIARWLGTWRNGAWQYGAYL